MFITVDLYKLTLIRILCDYIWLSPKRAINKTRYTWLSSSRASVPRLCLCLWIATGHLTTVNCVSPDVALSGAIFFCRIFIALKMSTGTVLKRATLSCQVLSIAASLATVHCPSNKQKLLFYYIVQCLVERKFKSCMYKKVIPIL